MAPAGNQSHDYLLKRMSPSARSSLDSDDQDLDTTQLLEGTDDARGKVTSSFSRQGKAKQGSSCPTWSSCTIIGILLAGLIGVIASGGYYVYKKEAPYGQSPPWYPSPRGGTLKSWEESYRKAAMMVGKMSLMEKVNITTGVGWASGLCVGNSGPAVNAGFPELCLQDGPLGLRFSDHVSVYPAGITVGATFNKDLMYRRGKLYGQEARDKGVNAILGPCMGAFGKITVGGRNWEGFGPDPVLQGIASHQTIKGIQDGGVMATAKHFIGNEQERFRQPFEWGLPNSISSNIDDRTMHELYAWPFADSVRAGVASVMCSYNMVNNSQACANSKLMNGLLKDELGFQGFVQSDWLAQRSGVASALAGMDMTMPGDGLHWADADSLFGEKLTIAVLNGSVPMERMNDMAIRIVAAWYQLGQDNKKIFPLDRPNFSSWTNEKTDLIHWSSGENLTGEVNQFVDVQGYGAEFHGRLAKEIAEEGTVLVKNEENILPLSRNGWLEGGSVFHVGIYGDDAGPGKGPNACKDRACNEGTLASGWGSGTAEFPYLVTPLEALEQNFDSTKVKITSCLTNTPDIEGNRSIVDDQDLCMVFINADAGEGFAAVGDIRGDRNDLWAHKDGDKLVQMVAKDCGKGKGKTIVVVHSVGPIVLERWIHLSGVKAVVLANLPGQESGNALASVLFGEVDASGRLPYTVGRSLQDYGEGAQLLSLPNGNTPQQDFKEGLYVDYRHFDKYDIAPRFEFGFGLSYTNWSYTDLKLKTLLPKSALPSPRPEPLSPPLLDTTISDPKEALFPSNVRKIRKRVYPYIASVDLVKPGGDSYPYPHGYDRPQAPSEAGGAEGGNPSLYDIHLEVSCTLGNTGARPGKEVVQVYVGFPSDIVDVNGDSINFPVRVLRGFEKIELAAGQNTVVKVQLSRKDLSYWSVVRQNWVMPVEGLFTVWIGRSSRSLELKGKW